MQKIALTGDRPTGKLHIGHFVGSIQNRLKIQDQYKQFVMIADAQALTDHADRPELIQQSIKDVMLDYLACGIDPAKTTIFIQSKIPALFELSFYFLNLVTWNRLKHNPTVKQEMIQKGYDDSVPAGFMVYPISQAADILAFNTEIVPVGEDQLPMIEQTNEIARHFNRIYKCEVFKEVKAIIPQVARLPGTDGRAKMGKSLGNCIYLSDPMDVVAKKVKGMYTDPNHLRVEDPGQVEGNPVFTYLDAFDDQPNELQAMKEHYMRGGLGDSIVKKRLLEKLEAILGPIRDRRLELEKNMDYVLDVLNQGTHVAKAHAHKTLIHAKQAMGIEYPYIQ
jgi:tryptophanyl-tRNA synthetase